MSNPQPNPDLVVVIGCLVEDSIAQLDAKVRDYVPEIRSGYAGVTVQDVFDMNLVKADTIAVAQVITGLT